MDCFLKKHLKEEHANMRDPRHGNISMVCPIFDRQICMWCCLHVRDVANPLTRNHATDQHPNYAIKASELSERSLDSIWETCSSCHNG